MNTGGINRKYFDVTITGGSFSIEYPKDKPRPHGCALETLKKIERILQEDLQYKANSQAESPPLPEHKLWKLQDESRKIHESYTLLTDKLGWFARKFFSKEKQINKIYNKIQSQVDAKLKKLRAKHQPRDQLPIVPDAMHLVSDFLTYGDLMMLGGASKGTKKDVESAMPELAKEYGYTGPPIAAKTWVRILDQVERLAQHKMIPDKYIIRENGQINKKETIKKLKGLTTTDMYTILSQKKLYTSGCNEFLSTFHVQRGWRPPTQKMSKNHIRLGTLALTLAVQHGQNEVVELLLEHKANPNVPDGRIFSLIDQASRKGYKKIVELLLNNTVKVHSGTLKKQLLHWACDKEHIEVVEFFLKRGENCNIPNEEGRLPIHEAALHGNTEIVRLLIEHGANVNPETGKMPFKTPLQLACCLGHTGVIKLLLKHKADPNPPSATYYSPIYQAALHHLHGNTEIVRLLIEHGANLNPERDYNETPLQLACYLGRTDLVKLLLENGANPYLLDEKGFRYIHHAVIRGDIEIIQMLLRKGARLDVSIHNHRILIDSASKLKNPELRTRMLALLQHPEQELAKLKDPFLKPE